MKNDRGSTFDYATHTFRAFAIICVMACHFCAMTNHTLVNRVFFTAATHFFLFISGYLCQLIYTKRPDTPLTYYRKKLTNVIAPYVLFSTIISLVLGQSVSHDLLYGSAQAPYWYIPFVTTLFVVSPLICRMKSPMVLAAFVLTFVLSVIIPERQFPLTWQYPGVVHLYTYFVPYYLLGFVYARYKECCDELLVRFLLPIGVVALALYGVLFFYEHDLIISLQRLAMIGVALRIFKFLGEKKLKLVDLFATTSFTLYFTHDFFFHGLLKCVPAAWRCGITDALVFLIGALLLVAIAEGLRRVLGRFSRPLIGS